MFRILSAFVTHILFPTHQSRILVSKLTPSDITSFLNPYIHDGVYVLSNYRHPTARALLWQAKYYGNKKAFGLLGNMLGNTLERAHPGSKVLVPIPLSRARLRDRGYNQVNLIIEEALPYCRDTILCTDLLLRKRHTRRQTTLPREKRLANLTNAFKVSNADAPKDAHILLIDDVMTTGTTLREAKHTLEEAGYITVTCVALAH